MAIQDAFIWGAGGKKLTPEEAERRRQVENALLAKGLDFSPVGHWTQGLARVADAAAGAFRRYDLSKGEKQIEDVNKGLIANLLAGGSGASSSPSASIPMSGAAGEVAATSPSAQPIDLSGNEVYNQFIGAAREGGLTNPYGLAALAATGKAESGFDPGNVNRTWSDPSQSGQPGTAGGILSWRGPRYQALAATGDLSPAGQARFFLQEDPGLVQALNNAKSVEEAQSLINNAWKFAGYDRADGETARRLGLARSFLPAFQGGGEVAAATPEAAIEAIAPLQPVLRGPLPASSYAGQERMPPQSLSEEVAAYQQTPEYAAAFPGRQQPASSAQPVQVAGGGDRVPMASASTGINPAIIEALTNPQASEQAQRIATILLQQDQARQNAALDEQNWRARQAYEQELQANDPVRKLQLEKGQLEIDALRNPNANIPDSVRALNIRAQQAGLQPGTPEYQRFMLSGGDKGITINNEGTIPAGYQAVRDAEGRVTAIQPIPGSPAALEMEQALKTKENQGGRKETATDVITNAASNARNILKNNNLVTGTPGKLASYLSESPAAELRRQVGVLKSQATIETLTAMRQASPTGGALGSVTEKEGAMLAAAAGAIDPDASLPDVQKALDDYEHTLLRVIHGPKVGDAIFEQTRTDPNVVQTDIPGVKIRRKN